MIERKKTYKIDTKLATCNGLQYAVEAMCEFWFCKPEEIELQPIHDNLFRIVKNGRNLQPVLWWQDRRCRNTIVRIWHFCTLVESVN